MKRPVYVLLNVFVVFVFSVVYFVLLILKWTDVRKT
jgi:hypothetical protein